MIAQHHRFYVENLVQFVGKNHGKGSVILFLVGKIYIYQSSLNLGCRLFEKSDEVIHYIILYYIIL